MLRSSYYSHRLHIIHTFHRISLYQHQIYRVHNFYSISTSSHPGVLLYILMTKILITYPQPSSPHVSSPLLPLSFSLGMSNRPIILPRDIPLHPFRSSITPNLYPLPTLSKRISKSFQNLTLSSSSIQLHTP